MPDIRLRPATGVPSDVALGPSVDSRVDIVLRPIPGSDVSLTANVQPAAAQTEAPAESYTLSAVLQQAAASVTGTLTGHYVLTGSVTQQTPTLIATLSIPATNGGNTDGTPIFNLDGDDDDVIAILLLMRRF